MIWNSALMRSVTKEDKKFLCQVIDVMNKTRGYLDTLHPSRVKELPAFECHAICRAIARYVTGLVVVDGKYFGLGYPKGAHKHQERVKRLAYHSWLRTPAGAIIDPYPVGFITPNPVLVVNRGAYQPFGSGLYIPDKRVRNSFHKLNIAQKSRILYALVRVATAS